MLLIWSLLHHNDDNTLLYWIHQYSLDVHHLDYPPSKQEGRCIFWNAVTQAARWGTCEHAGSLTVQAGRWFNCLPLLEPWKRQAQHLLGYLDTQHRHTGWCLPMQHTTKSNYFTTLNRNCLENVKEQIILPVAGLFGLFGGRPRRLWVDVGSAAEAQQSCYTHQPPPWINNEDPSPLTHTHSTQHKSHSTQHKSTWI